MRLAITREVSGLSGCVSQLASCRRPLERLLIGYAFTPSMTCGKPRFTVWPWLRISPRTSTRASPIRPSRTPIA